MLVDVEFKGRNADSDVSEILDTISKVINKDKIKKLERIQTGIYELPHFSLDHELGKEQIKDYWPELEGIDCYGVCDDVAQLVSILPKEVIASARRFVIGFHEIVKEEESKEGGWRWHKWGTYYGNKNTEHEYIADEDESIKSVICFHIAEVI